MDYPKIGSIKLLKRFGLSTLPLMIIMALLTVMNLFGSENTFHMATVTYGIKIILDHVQRCLTMLHEESHPNYLVLIQHNVLGYM